MPKITNEYYLKFLKQNEIDLIESTQLTEWIKDLPKKKHPRKGSVEQSRALLICLYFTGARPSEIVDLCAKDIELKKYPRQWVYEIHLKTLKGGISRSIPIPKNPLTIKLYEYSKKQYPEAFIFYAFRSLSKNKVRWKQNKDMIVKENGEVRHETFVENKFKEYIRKGKKVNDYIVQWTGYPAYFFRHHRFSYMADKGASDNDMQFYKGAKSPASVEPYKHMSTQRKQKLAKYF
jgi:integrase